MRLRTAALALALVALPLLGGCSVKLGSSDDDNPVAATASDAGRIRFDLTDGLTRAEVGMPEGRSSYSIGNTGGEPTIAVTVVLADDVVITRDVADVSFRPDDLTDRSAEPAVLELSQRRLDRATTREILDRSVDELGLDAGDVAGWAQDAATAPDDPYTTFVLRGRSVGSTRVEVEVARFAADRYGVRTILTLGGA